MEQKKQDWFRGERTLLGLLFAVPAGIFLYRAIIVTGSFELWTLGLVALLAFPWSLISFVIGFSIWGYQDDPLMVKLLLHAAVAISTLGVFFNMYFLARFYYARRKTV